MAVIAIFTMWFAVCWIAKVAEAACVEKASPEEALLLEHDAKASPSKARGQLGGAECCPSAGVHSPDKTEHSLGTAEHRLGPIVMLSADPLPTLL